MRRDLSGEKDEHDLAVEAAEREMFGGKTFLEHKQSELLQDLPFEPGQHHREYKSIHRMLKDVVKFASETPCVEILSADDPRQRLIGVAAYPEDGSDRVWFCISLTSLRNSLEEEPLPSLRESLKSAAGRIQLCKLLAETARKYREEMDTLSEKT